MDISVSRALLAILIMGYLSTTGVMFVSGKVNAQPAGVLMQGNNNQSVSTLSLNKNDTSLVPGEEMEIDIIYDNPTNSTAFGFEYDIEYNSSLIKVENHSPSGFRNEINNSNGVIKYATSTSVNPDTANVTISTITVTPVAGIKRGDKDDISFNRTKVITPGSSPIPTTSEGTSIRVQLLEDAATDINNDGKYEDINGDGVINMDDVSIFFQRYKHSTVQNNRKKFDFTSDGKINIIDVSALFNEV